MHFLRSSFLLLGTLLFQAVALAAAPVETYEQLLSAIRHVRAESEARVEQAVEAEKVREAWETGKLIDRHVLGHQRADYGQQVLARLARDLGTSDTELGYMLQFARTYPIYRPAGKLSWSHYQSLMALNDPEERKEVAEKAAAEGWGRDRVREEVKKRKAKNAETIAPLPKIAARAGKVGLYRIVKADGGPYQGELVIDLGFSNYYKPAGKFSFKEGELVTRTDGSTLQSAQNASASDLYTYNAYVTRVLDGDTVSAIVDLGFGITTVQILRLRGIDAPEIESAEGKEAKIFLESQVTRPTPQVLIRSIKSDKYDRYLADVFKNGEYVNQKLVDGKFAAAAKE